jgi:hypothetical protein
MKANREQLSNSISDTLETLIVKGTGIFPGVKPNPLEVVDRVNVITRFQPHLYEPIDFFDPRLPVAALDKAAKDQTRKAQYVAAASGITTGLFGMPGMAVDLPVLVANTVGLVRRHALVYGFTTIEDSTNDPKPLLFALGASIGADMVIDRVGATIGEKVGLDLSTKLVEKYLVKRVSEQFAARLMTSWLPRLVPIIGTATIAALDTVFLTLVGRESSRYFRERHVAVREYLTTAHIDRAQWKTIAASSSLALPGSQPPIIVETSHDPQI